MKTHLKKIILMAAIGAGLAVLGAWAYVWFDKTAVAPSVLSVQAENFGGPFSLTDHNGKPVTDRDFSGQYRLIYFGFTFCPAICPTELQKISGALDLLGERSKKIRPLFITVDPERDTADVMKNYVRLFHPDLVGLTGTAAQIEAVKKSYKVYSKKVRDPDMNDYTVDHSSFIYFMDPEDRLLSIFTTKDTSGTIAGTVGKWLDQSR
ncbi:MAG: SCO family protein [Rhodospirillales bacterium]|nr:SCO family protein [Alphaproteobacteria bacterium]USO04017.1 MAG: SCO family protein [Rhodospirillales bacterium]